MNKKILPTNITFVYINSKVLDKFISVQKGHIFVHTGSMNVEGFLVQKQSDENWIHVRKM